MGVVNQRNLVWFSCGAASAVAAKIAVKEIENVEVIYCDTGGEHESNKKFLLDVQDWIGQEIKILKSPIYKDHWDVFRRTRFLVGMQGARCTVELKKKCRLAYQTPLDVHIFGYTKEEKHRAERFNKLSPDLDTRWILIEKDIGKDDCLGLIWNAGIELPKMYRLNYDHNNCIGCVKGKKGYWNKIRRDFPGAFEEMAKIEREIGYSMLRKKDGSRLYLDELDPSEGNYKHETPISCGLDCQTLSEELVD